jgi:hypothetical protein
MVRERLVIFLPLSPVSPIIRIFKDLDACSMGSAFGRDMLPVSELIKCLIRFKTQSDFRKEATNGISVFIFTY